MSQRQSLPPWRGKVRMGGIQYLIVLLCLPFMLLGCEPSGDQVGDVSAPTEPSEQVERQAVANLLDLYHQAILNEDIDRLQSLLLPEDLLPAPSTQRRHAIPANDFRESIGSRFRRANIQSHALQEVSIAEDRRSATFIEVLSSLDPDRVIQQTEVCSTTFRLIRLQEGEVFHFRIANVQRDGPLAEVITPGLVVSGPPTPIMVLAPTEHFKLAGVEVSEPQSDMVKPLGITRKQADGTFIAQSGTQLHSLPVRVRGADDETIEFDHRYRLHLTQEGIAQRISGARETRFFAVTVTRNGTVWAGGDRGATLYQVAPGTSSVQQFGSLLPLTTRWPR